MKKIRITGSQALCALGMDYAAYDGLRCSTAMTKRNKGFFSIEVSGNEIALNQYIGRLAKHHPNVLVSEQ